MGNENHVWTCHVDTVPGSFYSDARVFVVYSNQFDQEVNEPSCNRCNIMVIGAGRQHRPSERRAQMKQNDNMYRRRIDEMTKIHDISCVAPNDT